MIDRLSKTSASGIIFDITNYLFLGIFSLTVLYPFWTVVTSAFSSPAEVRGLGLHVWNTEWRTEAWSYVFQENTILRAYMNTFHRVLFGTMTSLLVTFTMAYPLSKTNLPGRGVVTFLLVFTLFFSGGLIPTYLLIRNLGLIDSRWVLVIPGALSAFFIIITRNFIMTIDQAMEDSAVIDGANYWTIMFRIIIPLSRPVLFVIALWAAVNHWNSWFDALIYVTDRSKQVLQLMLKDVIDRALTFREDDKMRQLIEQLRQQGIEPDWAQIPHASIQAATTLITIGPIILLYPFIQKHFVKGIMLGSIKG